MIAAARPVQMARPSKTNRTPEPRKVILTAVARLFIGASLTQSTNYLNLFNYTIISSNGPLFLRQEGRCGGSVATYLRLHRGHRFRTGGSAGPLGPDAGRESSPHQSRPQGRPIDAVSC